MSKFAGMDVSRETIDDLEAFSDLTRKWTKKINLVSPSSIPDLWQRHIVDSAQIFPLAPPQTTHWVDIGSGGGFPGIVVAILAKHAQPDMRVTLIESDQRKATFLHTAIRELALNSHVFVTRVDMAPPQGAGVVSARALTALPGLIPMLVRHLADNGVALLHKGQSYETEIEQAKKDWRFDLATHQSITDQQGRILSLKGISRV